jgi:hypothetical protein
VIPHVGAGGAEVLSDNGQALSLEAIAAHFKGRGRWRERLPTILETLEALCRAQRPKDESWRATALDKTA